MQQKTPSPYRPNMSGGGGTSPTGSPSRLSDIMFSTSCERKETAIGSFHDKENAIPSQFGTGCQTPSMRTPATLSPSDSATTASSTFLPEPAPRFVYDDRHVLFRSQPPQSSPPASIPPRSSFSDRNKEWHTSQTHYVPTDPGDDPPRYPITTTVPSFSNMSEQKLQQPQSAAMPIAVAGPVGISPQMSCTAPLSYLYEAPPAGAYDVHQQTKRHSNTNASKYRTKPCKYFFSPSGCLKGEKCNFSHDPASVPSSWIQMATPLPPASTPFASTTTTRTLSFNTESCDGTLYHYH